tara:strand:- start:2757 stop:3140 length:384 start_codon:yes stop_codon:yes gene_type:complete
MRRHLLVGRLGTDDHVEIPSTPDEQVTSLQLVAGQQSLDHGIGGALTSLKALGGDVPSAYKYSRIVNTYTIERKSSEWFLIDAQRTEVWGNADKDHLSLTPSQRDIAVSKFTKQFSVQPAVELAVAA